MTPEQARGQFAAGQAIGRAYALSPWTWAGIWWGYWAGTIEKAHGIYPWNRHAQ